MRKDAGLAVSDRLRLLVAGDADAMAVVSRHGDWIAREVLATELVRDSDSLQDHMAAETLDLDGVTVRVAFTRIG